MFVYVSVRSLRIIRDIMCEKKNIYIHIILHAYHFHTNRKKKPKKRFIFKLFSFNNKKKHHTPCTHGQNLTGQHLTVSLMNSFIIPETFRVFLVV